MSHCPELLESLAHTRYLLYMNTRFPRAVRYMQGISDWVWERVTNTAQWQGCRTSMLIHYFIASIQRCVPLPCCNRSFI